MKPRYDPRVFLALTLSPTMHDKLGNVQREIHQYLHNWHFTPQANFHVTLRFFGEVPENQIHRISDACHALSKMLPPLTLHWNKIDFFGSAESARVLYIGSEECQELTMLHEVIAKTFPGEDQRKQFRAHVTLAKARKNMEPGLKRVNANMLLRLREHGRIGPDKVNINLTSVHRDFALMETQWVGRAVEYEVRERYRMSR